MRPGATLSISEEANRGNLLAMINFTSSERVVWFEAAN